MTAWVRWGSLPACGRVFQIGCMGRQWLVLHTTEALVYPAHRCNGNEQYTLGNGQR